MNSNDGRLPHRNPNNFDEFSLPISQDLHNKPQSQEFPRSDTQPKLAQFPYDVQGENQLPVIEENENDGKALYWTQRQQNWLTLTYRLNPMDFASPELFKSGTFAYSNSPNPVACTLVFIFKMTILVLYFSFPYMYDYRISILRMIILLGAIDFWVIKNVCGRILVGLRWWVEIEDNGSERWVFETRLQNANDQIQRIHRRIFWLVQFFLALIFVGILISSALTKQFDIALAISIPAVLGVFNLWAFNMCNKVKKSRMGEFLMQSVGNKKSVKMPLKFD